MLRSAEPRAPGAALVVALVIASLPTSQEQDDMEQPEQSAEIPLEVESLDEGTVTPSAFAAVTTETLPANVSFPLIEEDGAQAEFMLMVLVPSILLALLLLSVVFLVIHRKRKRNKREPSSQGSHSALQTNELASENVKVPIFEEDTPSVMEIEMEELDKWMNSMNRNADYEGLPTLEEEKEPNHNSPRATGMAYGRSQARGRIGATAASLHHSHSNTRSKPSLRPTPQLTATPDL